MSAPGKRSFTSFVKPSGITTEASAPTEPGQNSIANPTSTATPVPAGPTQISPEARDHVAAIDAPAQQREVAIGMGRGTDERTRVVTGTGRVRTYTASRNLPGVTLRLAEDRWERLKMLSVQERRPIQEILGEALDGYMRSRGLRW